MRLYKSEKEMLETNYIKILSICNALQLIAIKNGNIQLIEQEDIEITLQKYIQLAIVYEYISEDEVEKVNLKIQTDISTILSNQKTINDLYFKNIEETNINFIKIFWNDLNTFKKFDVIDDILRNRVVKAHEDYLGEIIKEKQLNFHRMGLLNKKELIILSIAAEDKTLMSLSTILLTIEHKKELIEYYQKENLIKNKVEDYEVFLKSKI